MILTRLMGGLGNQMFQVAAAKSLAVRNNSTLFADVTFLEAYEKEWTHTPRRYELNIFSEEPQILDNPKVEQLRNILFNPVFRRLGKIFPSWIPVTYIKEQSFEFDPGLHNKKGNIYMEGYWQSEKYFSGITDDIREMFRFKEPLSQASHDLIRSLGDSTRVGIHVRRGDMVNNPQAAEFHGTCPPEYYEAALRILLDKIGEFKSIIFTDEPEYVKNNMMFPDGSVVVDWNTGSRNFEDIHLMSLCDHHIIANSSFSWWGAWLNPSKEKIVIAPEKWFRNPGINTSDLIPDNWMRI